MHCFLKSRLRGAGLRGDLARFSESTVQFPIDGIEIRLQRRRSRRIVAASIRKPDIKSAPALSKYSAESFMTRVEHGSW